MKPIPLPEKVERWSGIITQASAWAALQWLAQKQFDQIIYLAPTMKVGWQRYSDLKFFLQNQNPLYPQKNKQSYQIAPFPPKEDALPDKSRSSLESNWDRTAVLSLLSAKTQTDIPLIVSTPGAIFDPLPSRKAFVGRQIILEAGQTFPMEKLIAHLKSDLNYDYEPVCENPGEFAVRGNLIDIYPLDATSPSRVDFWGDDIESIRTFDPTTQCTTGTIAKIIVSPSDSEPGAEEAGNFREYLAKKTAWILECPEQMTQEYPGFFEVPERVGIKHKSLAYFFCNESRGKEAKVLCLSENEYDMPLAQEEQRKRVDTYQLDTWQSDIVDNWFGADRTAQETTRRKNFLKRLVAFKEKERGQVYFVFPGESEETHFRDFLKKDGQMAPLLKDGRFLRGELAQSFRVCTEEDNLAFVTDQDIFQRERTVTVKGTQRSRAVHTQVEQHLDFSELIEGDYLVHLAYGVCRYRGLETIQFDTTERETISLEFADKIRLSLPLTESHLLTRYVGLKKIQPVLGKPGSNRWEKTRRHAENATLDLAAELLEIQAKRNTQPGYAFPPDTEWQMDFEALFPYEETKDQAKAIATVKADMESTTPMDRLLCGDVGFGKTEVAIRAAFKAVMAHKQVVVLVPTTVLCQQHYLHFRERLARFPVNVEMLSRFRTTAEQQKIKTQLIEGRIDIVVGTHSLLGKGVGFKDLGLMVIDEEHRFGVKQKESIKRMRSHVDVLSMSATPIPRTLYMALSGARDLSLIETPPKERLPVQTLVKPYSEEVIVNAIERERNRGGQIFYLHNRVHSINAVAKKLKTLMPTLRIAVGHGQLKEKDLEEIMRKFMRGEYDLLLCTTIIESGIDIPNCNTLIVEGADRFGLSQLYQLRGRVGRFNRQAYAYLLLHRHAALVESARKRLSAIRQYNQLGAGYRIALRDLELRGAGNLIGAEQSGEIAGVGFDLYCQLLRHSIARLKGEKTASHIRAEIRLDFIVRGLGEKSKTTAGDTGFQVLRNEERSCEKDIGIEAEIPAEYIPESQLRIDLYRRLGLTPNQKELEELERETIDRFGRMPQSVQALFLVTKIRIEAEHKSILSVETENNLLRMKKSGNPPTFLKTGSRFPRLNQKKPLSRLKEILQIIKQQ